LLAVLLPGFAAVSGQEELATITGRVIWPGHDVTTSVVQIAKDPKFQQVVMTYAAVTEAGTYATAVDPGEYYVNVLVDLDGNKRASPGDGVGWYGVMDLTDDRQRPRTVTARAGQFAQNINLRVSAVFGPDMKLQAIEPPRKVAGPPLPKDGAPVRAEPVTVKGILVWPGHTFENAVVWVQSHGWQPVACTRPDPQSGRFSFKLDPGYYLLLAFADVNGSSDLDAGDIVWSYGSAPHPGTSDPPRLAVRPDSPLGELELKWRGVLRNEGGVLAPDGSAVLFALQLARVPAFVFGRVVWREQIRSGAVKFSKDINFARLSAAVELSGPKGRFAMPLRAGDYYVSALIDLDGDENLGPGDLIGFYGAHDFAAGDAPAVLQARAGTVVPGVEIEPFAKLSEEGRPRPLEQR